MENSSQTLIQKMIIETSQATTVIQATQAATKSTSATRGAQRKAKNIVQKQNEKKSETSRIPFAESLSDFINLTPTAETISAAANKLDETNAT